MLLSSQLVGVAVADEVTPDKTKFINEYTRLAFGPDRPTLKKLDIQSPIPAAYRCEGIDASVCAAAFASMHTAIRGNNNLVFDFKANSPVVEFVFASGSKLKSLEEKAREEFQGGFSDTSDSDCTVFTRSDGPAIKQVLMLFEVQQPSLKLRLCLSLQLEQALGLNAFGGIPFAQQWTYPVGGLAQTTSEQDFETLTRLVGHMEYVHMCSELHPGMTPEQVRTQLSLPDSCVAPLFTK